MAAAQAGGSAGMPPEGAAIGEGLALTSQVAPVQAAGGGARPADAAAIGDPIARLKRQAAHALSGLASRNRKAYVLLAQPEAESEELHQMEFVGVSSCDTFPRVFNQNTGGADVVLVLDLCMLPQATLTCMRALEHFDGTILVVLLRPDENQEEEFELIASLLENGASDVMILREGQQVSACAVQMADMRAERLARRACATISREQARVQSRLLRILQSAVGQQSLWHLSGRVLESIPLEDSTLEEDVRVSGSVGSYALGEMLGSGSFGAIFKAEHPQHGARALKFIGKNSVKNMSQIFSISSEICILTNLPPHPNIIKVYEALHTPHHIVLVMECSGDINLHSFVIRVTKGTGRSIMPLHLVESFSRQAARGLSHMHASRVCHRDLTPKNFVVTSDGSTLKLADFGLACQCFGPHHRLLVWCGSLPFVAPELGRLEVTQRYGSANAAHAPGYCGFSADVWSLGVNLLELGLGMFSVERLLGWVPNPPSDPARLLQDLELLPARFRSGPALRRACLQTAVERALQQDPERRCSVQQLIGDDCCAAPHACPFHGNPLSPTP